MAGFMVFNWWIGPGFILEHYGWFLIFQLHDWRSPIQEDFVS